MANTQVINGQVYSWSAIRTNLFGRSIVGFDEINYKDKKTAKGVTGAGDIPYDSTIGDYVADADISLHLGEIVGIQRAIPKGVRIQDIPPFDIVVTYNNGTMLIKDILKDCRFLDNTRGGKGGSADPIKSKMGLYVRQIDWDV